MANLGSLCEKYATLVESKGGSDSNAPQLELLHEIFELLKTAPPDDIKAATPTLEKGLTASILQGPAAPVRRLISSCFCYAYARGARQTMYTTVGQLLSWLNNAKTPASSVLAKVATAAVLGELCEMHGGAMVSLCQDVINLMIKNLRTVTELPYRQISATALAAALAGSGGVNKEVQQEALKSLKGAFEERHTPLELRVACLQARCSAPGAAAAPAAPSPTLSLACPRPLHPLPAQAADATPGATLVPWSQCLASLARYSEQFWQGDLLDQISSVLSKALDDPAPPLRAAAPMALGETCGAALDAPWKLAQPRLVGRRAAGQAGRAAREEGHVQVWRLEAAVWGGVVGRRAQEGRRGVGDRGGGGDARGAVHAPRRDARAARRRRARDGAHAARDEAAVPREVVDVAAAPAAREARRAGRRPAAHRVRHAHGARRAGRDALGARTARDCDGARDGGDRQELGGGDIHQGNKYGNN